MARSTEGGEGGRAVGARGREALLGERMRKSSNGTQEKKKKALAYAGAERIKERKRNRRKDQKKSAKTRRREACKQEKEKRKEEKSAKRSKEGKRRGKGREA